MISLVDVVKHHRRGSAETVALHGVSLDIAAGEFVSIMGPSGSGKSTLLHLAGALDTATRGQVWLAGQDISTMSDHQLTVFRRKNLGFIFQFFNLLPTMTAIENAALPALLARTPRDQALSAATELLKMVGLGHRLDHRPDQLSGGEMQRVAIARALVNQPSLILADEPTGNLDSSAGSEILQLLRRATSERGVTVVMVTHDAQAAAVGDRIVQLKDGRIVNDRRLRPARAVAEA